MLRRSFTAVLEKGVTFDADFETEPYEAGWAREARWFVQVLQADRGSGLIAVPQISPDGAAWCDEGSGRMSLVGSGMVSAGLLGFGSWLRLRVRLTGTRGPVTVLIHLALKE